MGGEPSAGADADAGPHGLSRLKVEPLFSGSKKWEWALRGLLGFLPAALVADLAHVDPATVFLLAAVAIVPLSALLGRATEEYAAHAGPAIGGLLNATFGNAVELIIAVLAVSAGLFEVVKASLTGSIVANLLLILGMSMLAGGAKHKTMTLHRRGTMNSLSLMTLSVIALENLLTLARAGAVVLPASPGFYGKPKRIEDLVDFVVARILDHLDVAHGIGVRWRGLPE